MGIQAELSSPPREGFICNEWEKVMDKIDKRPRDIVTAATELASAVFLGMLSIAVSIVIAACIIG